MKIKSLFITTAAVEAGAGLVLAISPSLAARLLLSTSLDTPTGLTIGRIAGGALLALGIACWRARNDERTAAATGLIASMLFYNTAASVVIGYAGLGWKLAGIGLWPAVVLHVVMAVWCVACLVKK